MAIPWPSVLVPQRCDVNLRNFAASGGRTPTTRQQRVFSDAGFWAVGMRGLIVNTRAAVYAHRGLIAQLRQGEEVIVPTFDCYPPVGSLASSSSASINGDVALRATSMRLDVSGFDLDVGNRFSIGNRLHEITAIVAEPATPAWENQLANDAPWSDAVPWVDAVASTKSYDIAFLPPLRGAYPDGQAVRFDDTKVRCVLDNVADGDLELEVGRFGTPSLTFIESVS